MNVLITGAKGFLGKHLTSYLVEKHNLFLTARIKDDDKVDYLDLEDFDSVESYIEEQKVNSIEAVIHTAGSLINGDMSQEEQMKVFEDNITITLHIPTKNELQIAELQESQAEQDEAIATIMFGGELQ